jgi:hypothetical protein
MPWRPLSKRGQADPRLDEPVEGLPPYLRDPVFRWVTEAVAHHYADEMYAHRESKRELLQALQLAFRLTDPLDFSGDVSAANDLLDRMASDETFALDVVDYLLANAEAAAPQGYNAALFAEELNDILTAGGSVWEVVPRDEPEDGFQLARRAIGPVREAISDLPASSRAHQYLVAAWNRLSRRDPDPSGAYREAVRAVEAAAKPVILPANDSATLGQMIAALRDKPQKWKATIGSVDHIRQMMETVWTGQLDRHGTDDASVPLNVSHEEADAAFYLCLTLTRLFVGAHVSPRTP